MRTDTARLDDSAGLGLFALLANALTPPLGKPREHVRPDAVPREAPAPAPGLLDRLDTWFWRMEQRALEAQLAKSQDIYDLEARIRALERTPISRYY